MQEFKDFLSAGLIDQTGSSDDFISCRILYALFSLQAEYPMKERDFYDLADSFFKHLDVNKYEGIKLSEEGFRLLFKTRQGNLKKLK